MSAHLVLIGGGNMAQAVVFGALEAGLTTPGRMVVCEPDAGKRALFEERGVYATPSHDRALGRLNPGTGQVLLAVKPQALAEAAAQMKPHLPPNTVVITILAGTPSERVRAALAPVPVRVVRAMPSTAARVKQAATALCAGAGASKADCGLAGSIFAGLGTVEFIDESLMDAFTAVGGSGPAYLFYLAEAMTAAAVQTGLGPATADRVVRQTLLGAATLLSESPGEPAAALRAAVTSKGGTTEAAVAILDQRGVMEAISEAILGARDRGRELGGAA